jgi:uncharacterized protein with HEPN domain
MKKREYMDYLLDIYNSINDVDSFIKGMTYKDFILDRKTSNAVIRSIEVIGEAAHQIPKNIQDKYPSIPWKEMIGMRNKIIHEYFGINYKIVWKTAKQSIPKLKTQLAKVIKQERL